ncbi:MAG: MerR family transcriptional regulator [Minisyncoccia bacterium]
MDNKTSQQTRLIRGEAFSVNFSHYHFDETLEKFRQSLRNRKFTVGETEVSYRVTNHWGEKNLLPEGFHSEKGEWRKFTFVELVWLKVILHLREFGFSLEKIALAKEGVMKWKNNCYPFFEYYVAQALASTDDPYIIIWSDGQADIASVNELEISKILFDDEDKILISLKPIVSEIGLTARESDKEVSPSRNEKELLNAIRFGENNEVKVKIKNMEMTEMETTKVYPDNASMKDVNKKLKDKEFYGEKIEKIEEGVRQSVIEKRRYRFK